MLRLCGQTPLLARRNFLAGAGVSLLPRASTPALASLGEVRALGFDNLHTGEKLDIAYWEQGNYLPDALAAGESSSAGFSLRRCPCDGAPVLDLLALLRGKLETSAPFSVISGLPFACHQRDAARGE